MTVLDETRPELGRDGARGVPVGRGSASVSLGSLAEAVDRATNVVERAANALDEGLLSRTASRKADLALEPKNLLALLTFCYAQRIYGSTEVVARLQVDPGLMRFRGDELPEARRLRSFRCENRPAIQYCLVTALRFLAGRRTALGFATRLSEAHLAEEARRRIAMAMFLDRIELDKDQAHEVCDGLMELGH